MGTTVKKKLLIGIIATVLTTLVARKFWPAGDPILDRDASSSTGVETIIAWGVDGSRGKVGAAHPTRATEAKAITIARTKTKDLDLLEQEKRIAKLRRLNELVDKGTYRVEHLAATLLSDEGMWLKAAYLQGALDAKWTGGEADRALDEALRFLKGLEPDTHPDTMAVRAYHTSMQLTADLNRRAGGTYDEALKERYEKTGNPDYLKTIFDTPYKLSKIPSVPPRHAVAIVRESPSAEYVAYAKSLLGSSGITAEDRGDLNKYVTQHGSKSEWTTAPSDDRETKLMKLNGVAASKVSGKVEYIYRQWQDLFFAKITDDMSYPDWRALPNPTHELAQALWTEEDHSTRRKVEEEILGLLKRHQISEIGEQDQRKQRALVNLAVVYLDFCLSNLVPQECREKLADPRSFGAEVAREHLAAYLKRPDAAMALGTAKAYVEKVATEKSAP